MSAARTPGPWRTVKRSNQKGVRRITLCNDKIGLAVHKDAPEDRFRGGPVVGEVDPRHVDALEQLAARGNAHDDLVTALRLLSGWIANDDAAVETVGDALLCEGKTPSQAAAVEYLNSIARAALAKVSA